MHMQQELLPLFPLELVLLPGALQNKSEFGIVLAIEKGIVNTGCTAVVERVVKQYDDGRMDIIAGGRRRFEILLLNQEKDYLRGAVEFFDDDDARKPAPEARAKVEAVFRELQQMEGRAGSGGPRRSSEFSRRASRARSESAPNAARNTLRSGSHRPPGRLPARVRRKDANHSAPALRCAHERAREAHGVVTGERHHRRRRHALGEQHLFREGVRRLDGRPSERCVVRRQ